MSGATTPKEMVQSLIGLLSPEARTELLSCLLVQAEPPPSSMFTKAGVRAYLATGRSFGGPGLVVQINVAGEVHTKTFSGSSLDSLGSIPEQLAPLWKQAAEWLAQLFLRYPTCKLEELQ